MALHICGQDNSQYTWFGGNGIRGCWVTASTKCEIHQRINETINTWTDTIYYNYNWLECPILKIKLWCTCQGNTSKSKRKQNKDHKWVSSHVDSYSSKCSLFSHMNRTIYSHWNNKFLLHIIIRNHTCEVNHIFMMPHAPNTNANNSLVSTS